MVSLKDMPNLVGGGGGCSLDEFDPKRSKDLAQRIFDFNAKVGGGSGNPVKPGDAARGNNIESVQARSSAITSMAISGGASPEKYEPAALMAPGAIRRTNTGSYQVGWSWEKTGYPQKKWFSVGYKFSPLAAAYNAYPKWWLGIPTGCPYYQRYGYITARGPVNNATANAAAATPAPAPAPGASTTAQPAAAQQTATQQTTPAPANASATPDGAAANTGLGGGAIGGTVTMKGGPFGFGTEEKETTVTGGGHMFTRQSTLELATDQANQLRVKITHSCLVRIHKQLTKIAKNMNGFIPMRSTTACTKLLNCMEELYRCKVDHEQEKHQVAYMKALINVCLTKIHKDCPKIAQSIEEMLN
jgi:hypothetical protein